MADDVKTISGVQELINRFRTEGVHAGQQKADQVLQEAREQAAQIIAQAQSEAEKIVNQARVQIDTDRTAAEEAIQLSFRNTQLELVSRIKAAFSAHVKRLISKELRDTTFLRQLILAIAGLAMPEKKTDRSVEILMPEEIFVSAEKGVQLSEQGQKQMKDLVLGITREMLREGVELKPSGAISGGIRVRLIGEEVEIDLSDQALSELLLKHLLPRYIAIVTGVE